MENKQKLLKFVQHIVVVAGNYIRFSQLLKQELISKNVSHFLQFLCVFMDMLFIIISHLFDLHLKKVKGQPYLSAFYQQPIQWFNVMLFMYNILLQNRYDFLLFNELLMFLLQLCLKLSISN